MPEPREDQDVWYPVADEGQGIAASMQTGPGDEIIAPATNTEDLPQAGELTDWAQHFFSLEANLAAKLGFGVANISGSAKDKVVIAEFSRSKATRAANGKTPLRYGVALRLVIKVSNAEGNGSLNLPMIAAETQLGRVSSESHLAITGYAGEGLSKLIPPWKEFDVQSYVELMQSVSKIQELISSDIENIRPTLLQVYESATSDDGDDEREAAVGTVWALTRILDGASCLKAKESAPLSGSERGLAAIESTYRDLIGGECDGRTPDQDQRQAARQALGNPSQYRSPFGG